MAGYRSVLALISICIVVCLSGLGDCRIPFQKEGVVGEKEQSVHLLLPGEKEEFNEIARQTQALERAHLRGNDGIFHGERSRRFNFGRPGGCHHHHGKFKRMGQRKSEDMPFPIEFPGEQPQSTDFHPRLDWPLPEQTHLDGGFSGQERHGHPEEENKHMPFPPRGGWLEFFLHPFPAHEFHTRLDQFWPLPREGEFVDGFPKGGEGEGEGRQHREEERGEREKDNEHNMPFPDERRDPFSHALPLEEFPSRVDEFLPLPQKRDFEHGFPGREGRQPRHGHGHGHGHEHGEEEEGEFHQRRGPYVMEMMRKRGE